jgi:hypothetical protein
MSVLLNIVGWLAWVVDVCLAISFASGCRISAKYGRQFQWATALQTMIFWIVAVLFLVAPFPKAHIVWILLLTYLHLVALWLVSHSFLPPIVLYIPFPVPILLRAPLTKFLLSMFMRLVLFGARSKAADTGTDSQE